MTKVQLRAKAAATSTKGGATQPEREAPSFIAEKLTSSLAHIIGLRQELNGLVVNVWATRSYYHDAKVSAPDDVQKKALFRYEDNKDALSHFGVLLDDLVLTYDRMTSRDIALTRPSLLGSDTDGSL